MVSRELSKQLVKSVEKSVNAVGVERFIQQLLFARITGLGVKHHQLHQLVCDLRLPLVDSGEYYERVQNLADQYMEYGETTEESDDSDGDLVGQVVLDAIDAAYYAEDEHELPYVICEALIGEELTDAQLLTLVQSLALAE